MNKSSKKLLISKRAGEAYAAPERDFKAIAREAKKIKKLDQPKSVFAKKAPPAESKTAILGKLVGKVFELFAIFFSFGRKKAKNKKRSGK